MPKDRPIIFSGGMIRALLDGNKTQTRRLATSPLRRCEVGDRLYVREAFTIAGVFTDVVDVRYQSSERSSYTEFVEQVPVAKAVGAVVTFPRYKPSIHMPRWASRLTLTVTEVRMQRLQDITNADAAAEGIMEVRSPASDGMRHYGTSETDAVWPTPVRAFRALWNSLHTKSGETWDDNPEIVALTFTVARGNIDA